MYYTEIDNSLKPTYHLDTESDSVQRFIDAAAPDRTVPKRELAIRLHDAVRDKIRYDVYRADVSRDGTRASAIINRGRGFCVHKSIVYATVCRAVGIPARLVYGDVQNHLASARLLEIMGGDTFTYHALNSIQLDDSWIRVTPVFNTTLCRLYGIHPLVFDGHHDSYYHPYDTAGRKHMEFIRWRGEYDDFPWETVVAGIARNHPRFVGDDLITASGSLTKEVQR